MIEIAGGIILAIILLPFVIMLLPTAVCVGVIGFVLYGLFTPLFDTGTSIVVLAIVGIFIYALYLDHKESKS